MSNIGRNKNTGAKVGTKLFGYRKPAYCVVETEYDANIARVRWPGNAYGVNMAAHCDYKHDAWVSVDCGFSAVYL